MDNSTSPTAAGNHGMASCTGTTRLGTERTHENDFSRRYVVPRLCVLYDGARRESAASRLIAFDES